jgi:hypothetical protein
MTKQILCDSCRKSKGFKRRDNGCHTAERIKCNCCGNVKGIISGRHWTKESNND